MIDFEQDRGTLAKSHYAQSRPQFVATRSALWRVIETKAIGFYRFAEAQRELRAGVLRDIVVEDEEIDVGRRSGLLGSQLSSALGGWLSREAEH